MFLNTALASIDFATSMLKYAGLCEQLKTFRKVHGYHKFYDNTQRDILIAPGLAVWYQMHGGLFVALITMFGKYASHQTDEGFASPVDIWTP